MSIKRRTLKEKGGVISFSDFRSFLRCTTTDTECEDKNKKINEILQFYSNTLHITITNPQIFSYFSSVEELNNYGNNPKFLENAEFQIKDDDFYDVDLEQFNDILTLEEKNKIKEFISRNDIISRIPRIYNSAGVKYRVIINITDRLKLSRDSRLYRIDITILNKIYSYIIDDVLLKKNGDFIKSIISHDKYNEYLAKFEELNYDLEKLKTYIDSQQNGGNKKIKKKIIKKLKIYKQKK